MGYSNNVAPVPTPTTPLVEYHDTVRWGPIFSGIVVSIVSQLMLSALGATIGGFAAGEAAPGTIGAGIGIWAIISLLISLFLGGWTMAAACGPMNSKTAMLNATIMWATTLVISGWLLASGVSGTFGIAAANAGGAITQVLEPGGVSLPSQAEIGAAIPNVSAQEAANYAATASKAGLSFLVGTLLGLVAALIGATVGAKKPRVAVR
ncbi:MAG: hypothetical protein AAFQ63_20850 [Cyanobacteria bacterium J06621_11]